MQSEHITSEPKKRRGIGWIILGAALLLAGAGGGAVGMFITLMGSLDGAQRAVFPGEHVFTIDEAGTYTIALEYRSVIDGRTYTSPEAPPSTEYRLVSMGLEGEVDLKPVTGSYTYQVGAYEGKGLFTAQIASPGDYMLMAHYADRADEPEFVLAVQPGTFWGHFASAMLFGCGGGLAAMLGITFIIVGIVRLITTEEIASSHRLSLFSEQ